MINLNSLEFCETKGFKPSETLYRVSYKEISSNLHKIICFSEEDRLMDICSDLIQSGITEEITVRKHDGLEFTIQKKV